MISVDTSDWYLVMIQDWKCVTEDWLVENLEDKYIYTCFGHYWYFKNQSDAILFRLAWG